MENKLLKQIEKNVLRELGDGAESVKTDIQNYRDSVFKDIAAYYQWTWLENVPVELASTDGQAYIEIPSYLEKITSVYKPGDGRPIEPITESEYAQKIAASTAVSNKPRHRTLIKNRMYLYPTPSGAGDITFSGTISADLLDDHSDPSIDGIRKSIPDHFATIVEWGILRKLDSLAVREGWAKQYFMELEVKRNGDYKNKGRNIKPMLGRSLKAARRHLHRY